MAAFRNLTRTTVDPIKSNALIMGRLTFDSLPRRRPLPGRIHVVLTRRPPGTDVYPEGVLTAPSIDDALAMLAGRVEKVFVVGGARAYSEAITHPACEGLWLTQIINPDYPDADVFFPDMPLGMYDRGQALDEPAQECGVTYQRFYHARVAVAADP
jgi:dihydrofolate reductase